MGYAGHNVEDSDDPLGAVSGNFDGMGISLGVLQWNIGSRSLQPIVQTIGKAAVTATMPQKGEDLWRACNTTVNLNSILCHASRVRAPCNDFRSSRAQ